MADSVNVTYTDRRTIELKTFNNQAATVEFSRLVQQAASDGYVIKDVVPLTSGHQRDPYTTGVRITMERTVRPVRPEPPKVATIRDTAPSRGLGDGPWYSG